VRTTSIVCGDSGHSILGLALLLLLPASSLQAHESIEDYIDMPLADLLSMEVTSVSKKKQPLNETAAAVFVITQEDIRRSGVTSIPEALRLAPGIQVGRIDANKWAISSRGFANQFANKLLVMIDGRTVYNPSFSGVYWDVQDTLLEDIERIEVIRGPGATVWGANAVNGVINIITREASQTQGGLLSLGAGNEEKAFAGVRYGVETHNGTAARMYIKYNDRDDSYARNTGKGSGDNWRSLRGGFRADGQFGETDRWTIHGDAYQAEENQNINLWKDPADPANAVYAPFFLATDVPDSIESSGWNLLGKWNRRFSASSEASLQLYIDHSKRAEEFLTQKHDTVDIDFQHQYHGVSGHEIVWGLGYRRIQDHFSNTFVASFLPDSRALNLYSAFLQDEIELVPDTLRLTLGTKLEHNDFTGLEVQPSIRLAWLPNERSTFWGAISRAVRTPSRLENGSRIVAVIAPAPPAFTPKVVYSLGTKEFQSEELLAYEAGYRVQPKENLSLDLAVFYNDYENLQSFEKIDVQDPLSDVLFDNTIVAHSYGLELAMDWRPLEWWRLQSNYSFIEISSSLNSDSSFPNNENDTSETATPKHQFSVRSMMDLGNQVAFDLWVYYVGDLERPSYSVQMPVPAYVSLNASLAWHPTKTLEFSLVAQNLLDDHHLEFVGENLISPTEVERSIYGGIRWDF